MNTKQINKAATYVQRMSGRGGKIVAIIRDGKAKVAAKGTKRYKQFEADRRNFLGYYGKGSRSEWIAQDITDLITMRFKD